MGVSVEKLAGGKLLRVEYDGSVKVTGDFFLYPEEKITDIEQFLAEHYNSPQIVERFQQFVTERHIEMIGVTPEAIINNLKKAMQ